MDEFYPIQGQMPQTIDAYDDSIHTDNRLSNVYVTRDEFLHQIAQLRKKNELERLEERKETYGIVQKVKDRVKANHARGLLHGEKIGNLEDKVEGVNKMFEELDGKIDNLSRECLYLKQRLMEEEEIPEITEKETMERIKPTQLSPYVSNVRSSTITLEMADRCAKAVFVNNDVDIKEKITEKLSSVNQKVISIENKPRFSCEICGHGNLLKNSLISHMRKKHFLTSRGRPIGENRPQVEKIWCTHCKNKNFVHAKTCAKHESVCVKNPKPTTASATMESSSVQESGKLDPSISLATADEFTDGPTN